MHYKKLNKITTAALSTVLLLCSSFTFAHPHNWIDLRTQVDIDDQGRLTGFTQHWKFDQFFSMINYAELMNEYNDEPIGLASTAIKMVANVAPDQYFSELKVAGEVIDLPVPKRYTLETEEVDGNPILILKMKFVLKEPPQVEGKSFTLQTFEPTYFVAMNYPSEENIRIDSASVNCKAELIRATPSDELIDYANSLDRNVRDTQGLGDDFAERVKIQC
jgi:ABC-type uncharacterized transport system substrate-binding protein